MSKKTTSSKHDHDHAGHSHDHDHGAKKPTSPMISENTTILVTIPWAKAEKAYQKSLRKLSTSLKLPGFRKGKVPTNVAEEALGKPKIISQTLDLVLPEAYKAALEKSKKKSVVQPEFEPVSIEMNKDWKLQAIIAEEPEIKLGKYKKIITEARKKAEQEISKNRKKAAKDTKDKSAKKETAEEIEANKKQEQNQILQEVLKALTTDIKPAIPELMVKRQTQREIEEFNKQLKGVNLTIDDYLARRKTTEQELLQELTAASLAQLQTNEILRAIMQTEKITVSDSDIKKMLGDNYDKKKELPAHLKDMVEDSIRKQKVIDFLVGA
jgi:FKBP-type peptidyl-prolyl cis-trans isomerase (trigger factor)